MNIWRQESQVFREVGWRASWALLILAALMVLQGGRLASEREEDSADYFS